MLGAEGPSFYNLWNNKVMLGGYLIKSKWEQDNCIFIWIFKVGKTKTIPEQYYGLVLDERKRKRREGKEREVGREKSEQES